MWRGESSCNRDRNAEVTAGPLLWAPDVDISRKHRSQIECICTYHCILREILCPVYHTPKHPWGWSRCRDCVRTSFCQAYTLYRRLDIPTMLWHQTCFFSVLLKTKLLSVFRIIIYCSQLIISMHGVTPIRHPCFWASWKGGDNFAKRFPSADINGACGVITHKMSVGQQ